MVELTTSRSCSASKSQSFESWSYVIDGVNKEHYVGNFIYLHEWQHIKLHQSSFVVGCIIRDACSLLISVSTKRCITEDLPADLPQCSSPFAIQSFQTFPTHGNYYLCNFCDCKLDSLSYRCSLSHLSCRLISMPWPRVSLSMLE